MSSLFVLLIIGLAIVLHELGHFLAARMVGIPIAQFAVGFGPKLWSWRRGETEYVLAALPLGGYVMPAIQDEDELRQFPLLSRLWYYVAGPLANVLTVALLFALLNIVKDGPSLWGLFVAPLIQTGGILAAFVSAIPRIFAEPGNLSGVVGIVAAGDKVVGQGIAPAIFFAILLNVNLAVLNLLPIPPLDGAKILFALVERAIPAARRCEAPLMIAGWAFLLLLMAVVTFMDIGKLIS